MSKKSKQDAIEYMEKVNKTIWPGLIDAAEEWVIDGWGLRKSDPVSIATAIINNAMDSSTVPVARQQQITIAQNILNLHFKGGYSDDWRPTKYNPLGWSVKHVKTRQ